jgi:hypothetical protein
LRGSIFYAFSSKRVPKFHLLAVANMDAEYEATKRRKQLNLAEALADVQAAAAPSAERTAEMLNSLGTALKREAGHQQAAAGSGCCGQAHWLAARG